MSGVRTMAKKRKANAKARAVVERVDRGTAETREKMVLDAVAHLVAKGEMDALALNAAGAIGRTWRRLYSEPWWKLARYDERVDASLPTDAAKARAITEDQTYRRWTERAPQQRQVGACRVMALDIVHDAVVEQRGVEQIAQARRMDRRTVARVLDACLTDYAVVAGWAPMVARAA